jgi:biopolymer transport protein ExbD
VKLLVAPHGAIYWNDELITRAELEPRLAHYKTTTTEPRVFISGEETADFGEAVGVLDDVRAAGIKLVSLETRPHPTRH